MKASNRTLTEYPLPWTVEPDQQAHGYATVRAANGAAVPFLIDIELGWTDTSTGAYYDPAMAYDDLCKIIAEVNRAERIPPSRIGQYIGRVIAFPIVMVLVTIGAVRGLFTTAYRYLRYGGEWITYPEPRDRIATVYERMEQHFDTTSAFGKHLS